jgi:hypothetical protein
MSELIITVDLDWACEAAIEFTLDFLQGQDIKPTVFVTHRSPRVENNMDKLEVGLHPYFAIDSSHGSTINEVVKHIIDLPHNIPAFRCHRFATCNNSKQAMVDAGMLISSNVCTDLENIVPFKDRYGLLEVPIFLEDGGYLWRKHSLEIDPSFSAVALSPGSKVILLHPMHFMLNTPYFDYMYKIKQSVSRKEWQEMSTKTLSKLSWQGRGIQDFIKELIQLIPKTVTLGSLLTT